MIRTACLFLVAFLCLSACSEPHKTSPEDFPTPYESGNGNQTATYQETLEFYRQLAREFPSINLQTLGETDSGHPLHLVTYNPEAHFNFQRLGETKTLILVLNGIHPGESDGIDASMMLFRDLATGALDIPKEVVLSAIPVYNVGGALNRNSGTRANQNGPETYGFRGNARNFDLNRDFIKMDTRNARSFAGIFRLVQPDFFIDTHVSNGADYSYTLTHLFTQQDKLGGALGRFQEDTLRPKLEAALLEKGWDITPYVNVFGRPPDAGFSQFLDRPRYSTGYAALWDSPGLMLETHMLKPYRQRVEGTYDFLHTTAEVVGGLSNRLRDLRSGRTNAAALANWYPLGWAVDSSRHETLAFKGYQADTVRSLVTDLPQLRYYPDQPVTLEISYYNSFRAADSVSIPTAYLVPQQWKAVRDRLDWNRIRYRLLEQDTLMEVTAYRIRSYDTSNRPYEGHYPHFNTRVERQSIQKMFRAGDLLVPTNQPGFRYLLETLEPAAGDSFFNWNFFDPILQRKEGFSPYVFEESARRMLERDTALRKAFERRRAEDPVFRANAYAQLNWLFERSEHYEEAHLRYPVYRLE